MAQLNKYAPAPEPPSRRRRRREGLQGEQKAEGPGAGDESDAGCRKRPLDDAPATHGAKVSRHDALHTEAKVDNRVEGVHTHASVGQQVVAKAESHGPSQPNPVEPDQDPRAPVGHSPKLPSPKRLQNRPDLLLSLDIGKGCKPGLESFGTDHLKATVDSLTAPEDKISHVLGFLQQRLHSKGMVSLSLSFGPHLLLTSLFARAGWQTRAVLVSHLRAVYKRCLLPMEAMTRGFAPGLHVRLVALGSCQFVFRYPSIGSFVLSCPTVSCCRPCPRLPSRTARALRCLTLARSLNNPLRFLLFPSFPISYLMAALGV